MKNKLLIVGAFPKKSKKIYGGIIKSSKLIYDSKSFKQFDLIKFDTTQKSHPPPSFFLRSIIALLRLLKFPLIIFKKKPKAILIFCSDGGSALEKGLMILISKIFNVKSFIFPRAGNLINQVNKYVLFRLTIKILFNQANLFLCQGNIWKNFAIKSLNIKPKNIKVIQNWSASNELLKIGENRRIKNSENLEILFVGWLEKEKGVIELINAFYEISTINTKIKLRLVGDGSLRNQIKKFTRKNDLQNKIIMEGWRSSHEVRNYLKQSDIFILPSWKEGMPNALIEAIASGLPSITTSVGVIGDFIINDHNGLVIDVKSIDSIKDALNKLINNFELRQKLSKNGFLLAKNKFSTTTSLKNFSNIIQETLN